MSVFSVLMAVGKKLFFRRVVVALDDLYRRPRRRTFRVCVSTAGTTTPLMCISQGPEMETVIIDDTLEQSRGGVE